MNKTKITLYLSLTLASILILVASYSTLSTKPTPKPPIATPLKPKSTLYVAGLGQIEPSSELIAIDSNIPGIIKSFHVSTGQFVQKNDPLFSIDTDLLLTQKLQLQAQKTSALISLHQAQYTLSLHQSLANSPAISPLELNQLRFAEQSAQSSLNLIEAQLLSLDTQIQKSTVTAPSNGQILKIYSHTGEFVSGTEPPSGCLLFGDTSKLFVRVEIDATQAHLIQPQFSAHGAIHGASKKTFDLQFVRIEPYILPRQNTTSTGQILVDTRIMQIIYQIINPIPECLIGQQVDVFINLE